MTTVEDALSAAAAGADFIGTIRADSPRAAALERAAEICAALAGRPAPVTQAVLLFRDQPAEQILAEVDHCRARWVQLHGSESEGFVRRLWADRPALSIIRAWEIGSEDSERQLLAYVRSLHARRTGEAPGTPGTPPSLAAIIVDAPKGGPAPGFDRLRTLSRSWPADFPPLWCAGGLTPANVADAIRGGRFAGVDVARGVEVAPGVKDHAAIRLFIANARGALGTSEAPT
ncbi:MAG: phosphoribosylanthranilate isomerase [Phycisphaerales bacterium]|nr:phosphoribosylanthranilate isomerase [Phycisphaerales bacterium]